MRAAKTAKVAAGLVVAAGVLLAGCTKNEEDEGAGPAGSVAIDGLDLDLGAVDCAEPDATLYAAGVAPGENDRLTNVEVEVDGTDAVATVRTRRRDEVVDQRVGTGLTAIREDRDGETEVTVEGTFVTFDGPEQTGEAEGTVSFRCTADTDPGGGTIGAGATQATYDLVTCVETDESFEVVARSTTDETEQATLRRVRLRTGWVDTVEASGSATLDENEDLSDEAERATEVEEGLFTVRGGRVQAETAEASVDLTCGIDVELAGSEAPAGSSPTG